MNKLTDDYIIDCSNNLSHNLIIWSIIELSSHNCNVNRSKSIIYWGLFIFYNIALRNEVITLQSKKKIDLILIILLPTSDRVLPHVAKFIWSCLKNFAQDVYFIAKLTYTSTFYFKLISNCFFSCLLANKFACIHSRGMQCKAKKKRR